jgi:hydroxysqualene dehydroxylase
MRIAVVGGGWAGLAAAVRAVQSGHRVTLIEMAARLGGRARGVGVQDLTLDNGQHILIGAYTSTLALMRAVGADPQRCLARQRLELRFADGRRWQMGSGAPWLAFARATIRCTDWTAREKAALLATAARWAAARFECPSDWSVDRLCRGLPPPVRSLLIDPLCVAALNTPVSEASASVLLRVLRDALFGGAGSADLLLPRQPLAELLPTPAERWLRAGGAEIRTGVRAHALVRDAAGWRVDGELFDAVVVACPAAEAARLVEAVAPRWSAMARGLRHEPIVTAYLRCPGATLPAPMTALAEGPDAPAQFAFDHGALGGTPGVFAFVISSARRWVEVGLDAVARAVLGQARSAFASAHWTSEPTTLSVLAEKRATFSCTPGLVRPSAEVGRRLAAAGDYVEGPYPATLESAVRAGERAARLATG